MKSWILYGNFWVSAGAAALAYSTCLLHGQTANPRTLLLVFLACLFVYNYHRIFRLKHIYREPGSDRHRWIVANRIPMLAITMLAGIVSLWLFAGMADRFTATIAVPFLIAALLYVVPLYKSNGSWRRLRDIPFLKVFLISAAWTYATVMLPLSHVGIQIFSETGFRITLLQRFLFIMAISLPFDVRDLGFDRLHGVRTFAGYLGIGGVKKACHLLLLAMLLVVFAGQLRGFYHPMHAAGILISVLGTAWLISIQREDSSELYYTALLDGTMIDQLFWIWLTGLAA